MWKAIFIRESSKKRTVAREVAKVEALCRDHVRRPGRAERERIDRAGRGAHGDTAMVMALTVSGAFPSGSMVTAACPVTGILATGGGAVLPCVRGCVGADDGSLAGWLVDEERTK